MLTSAADRTGALAGLGRFVVVGPGVPAPGPTLFTLVTSARSTGAARTAPAPRPAPPGPDDHPPCARSCSSRHRCTPSNDPSAMLVASPTTNPSSAVERPRSRRRSRAEDRRQAHGRRPVHAGTQRAEVPLERRLPQPEEPDDVVGTEQRQERERRLELGELLGRGAHQVGEPVDGLGGPGVGEPVDGSRGPIAVALGGRGLDQAVLHQRVDDRVERAEVELHRLVLAALAQGHRHLVRVHRPLPEQREHGEGQGVAARPCGHRDPLPRVSSESECSTQSISRVCRVSTSRRSVRADVTDRLLGRPVTSGVSSRRSRPS